MSPGSRPAPFCPIEHRPKAPLALPWRLAAPSWVWPGSVAENTLRLVPGFSEISVVLFESEPTPAYDPADFPAELTGRGATFHLHLPLDLPWARGTEAVNGVLDRLYTATGALKPWASVLHAPPDDRGLASAAALFKARGLKPRQVLVENTADFDLCDFWCDIKYFDLGACLDLGHLLAYGQERTMGLPGLWKRVRMLHLCAPGENGRHESLARLDRAGRAVLKRMLASLAPGSVIVLELFSPEELFESLEELRARLSEWRMWPCCA
jgi:hypothetical protein